MEKLHISVLELSFGRKVWRELLILTHSVGRAQSTNQIEEANPDSLGTMATKR